MITKTRVSPLLQEYSAQYRASQLIEMICIVFVLFCAGISNISFDIMPY